MARYYLWAYPDNVGDWVGVGWVNGGFQRETVPHDYTDVTANVRAFPLDDAGWWYAQHDPAELPHSGSSWPDQQGRYERSYFDATLPGMTRLVTRGDV